MNYKTKYGQQLPKEFKEEVKKEWQFVDDEERLTHDAFLRGGYSEFVISRTSSRGKALLVVNTSKKNDNGRLAEKD